MENQLLMLIDKIDNETMFSEMDVCNSLFELANKAVIISEYSDTSIMEDNVLFFEESDEPSERKTGLPSKFLRKIKNLIQRIIQLVKQFSLYRAFSKVEKIYKDRHSSMKIPAPIGESELIKYTENLNKLTKSFAKLNELKRRNFGGIPELSNFGMKDIFEENLIPTFDKLYRMTADKENAFNDNCTYDVFKESIKSAMNFSMSITTFCNFIDKVIDESINNINNQNNAPIFANLMTNCFKTTANVLALYGNWCKYLINHDPNTGEPMKGQFDKTDKKLYDLANDNNNGTWVPQKAKSNDDNDNSK